LWWLKKFGHPTLWNWKTFSHHTLWWLKKLNFFSRQPCGDWKFAVTNVTLIEKNLVTTKGGIEFGGLLDGDRIFSIAIWYTPTIEWKLKFFNHQKGCEPVLSFWKKNKNSAFNFLLSWLENFDLHQMVWMCRISTKDFQSPSNGVGCWMATRII